MAWDQDFLLKILCSEASCFAALICAWSSSDERGRRTEQQVG